MKRSDIERKIIAARPNEYTSNQLFTDRVMKKLNKNEIITATVRTMNVTKKETFMTKFKHLPKIAIVAIVLGALLVLSGTAYAAYQLWAKPSAHLTQLTTSPSGREEAILSTKECGPSEAQHYELKKDATITSDRIPAIVQAQCELKAINDWAMETYAQGPDGSFGDARTVETPSVGLARQLTSVSESSITFAELKGYGIPVETYEAPSSTRFIAHGTEVTRSTFKPGDAVVYITLSKTIQTPKEQCTTDACREFGEYRGVYRLVAVVKLERDFNDYDNHAWQSLSERTACYGNPTESCIEGGASIDLYMGGVNLSEKTIAKHIQGTVTEINGKTVSIKGTSGTIYHVTTPTDVIKNYNENKAAQYYNNQKVRIGSTLNVTYAEAENEHSVDITASAMTFAIELISKGDPVKAY